MPGKHAFLSPSKASRWMRCTASPAREKGVKDKQTAFNQEGTQAHKLGELLLKKQYKGEELPADYCSDAEMLAYVQDYIDYITEIYNQESYNLKGEKPFIYIEERLDFSKWIPRSYGTADCIIEGKDTLHVIDLKYGKGIPVEAEENEQLKIYGLGALDAFNWDGNYTRVQIHIVQPRLDSIESAEYTSNELYEWAENVLRPKALEAFNGPGEYQVGDHCRFCRIATTCEVRQKHNLEELEQARDNQKTRAYIIAHADEWKRWLTQMQEQALQDALNGEKIEGFKVVEGRSNRKITDPEAVAQVLIGQGLDPYKPQELKTLTSLERLAGKKKFTELCGAYLIKPEGKPTLVPEDDKRPELHSAQDDFDILEDQQ